MDNTVKRNRIRVVVIILVLLGITALILLFVQNHQKRQPGHDTRYYDKFSGQTLSDINGKSPETAGTGDPGPLYLGFHTLIDHGFSQEQVNGVQAAIQDFVATSRPTTKHVSFDVKSFERPGLSQKEPDASFATFNVVFDFKDKYTANLTVISGQSINLKLFDGERKQMSDYTYDPTTYDQPAGAE